MKARIGLFLGPLFFFTVLLFVDYGDMTPAARGILASTVWIATWWITEAIPIAVTALLPLVLFPLTGGLSIGSAAKGYGDPIILLFVCAFIIAIAIERWNLHKRLALNIIVLMGTKPSQIILGFMVATAALSMWISNTAAALMMMPMGTAIIVQLSSLKRSAGGDDSELKSFAVALMLCIAYSASIGGMATIIGTPTNLVFAGMIGKLYDQHVSFAQWFVLGLPFSVGLLAIGWFYLTRFAFALPAGVVPDGCREILKELEALGKISSEEKRVLAVFAATAVAWISRSFILEDLLPGIDDTVIAVAGATVLFIIPCRPGSTEKLLDWERAVRIPWGIVLLFGGGLSIAAGFSESGLAEWLGGRMTLLSGVPYFLILLVVILGTNFLTEITSNVATASVLLPVLAGLALAVDVHPYGLMIGGCIAASCAFMLPVATPPNAVIFSSGYVRMEDMVRAGFAMNIISTLLLTIYIYLLLPLLWEIDLMMFPEMFR